MPHYFQFYEDYIKNHDLLNIQRAAENLTIPHLIIHGDQDTSIMLSEAKALHQWNPNSKLEIIKGANHVFETYHPWEKQSLSKELQLAVDLIIEFVEN